MAITNFIDAQRQSNLTNASPTIIYDLPVGTSVRLWFTGAGTATVYTTGSPRDQVAKDTTNGNITGSTNARWTQWGAGSVTVETVQVINQSQTALAVVVTSGTWSIEVTR